MKANHNVSTFDFSRRKAVKDTNLKANHNESNTRVPGAAAVKDTNLKANHNKKTEEYTYTCSGRFFNNHYTRAWWGLPIPQKRYVFYVTSLVTWGNLNGN